MANRLNIDLFARVMSEILSEKHGLVVNIQAAPKGPGDGSDKREGREATA